MKMRTRRNQHYPGCKPLRMLHQLFHRFLPPDQLSHHALHLRYTLVNIRSIALLDIHPLPPDLAGMEDRAPSQRRWSLHPRAGRVVLVIESMDWLGRCMEIGSWKRLERRKKMRGIEWSSILVNTLIPHTDLPHQCPDAILHLPPKTPTPTLMLAILLLRLMSDLRLPLNPVPP